MQPSLRVVDRPEVEVVARAPSAATVPLISAEELLAFRVTGLGEQRVRIDGVVAAAFGGEQVFLQQGARAFAVRLGTGRRQRPGRSVLRGQLHQLDLRREERVVRSGGKRRSAFPNRPESNPTVGKPPRRDARHPRNFPTIREVRLDRARAAPVNNASRLAFGR